MAQGHDVAALWEGVILGASIAALMSSLGFILVGAWMRSVNRTMRSLATVVAELLDDYRALSVRVVEIERMTPPPPFAIIKGGRDGRKN